MKCIAAIYVERDIYCRTTEQPSDTIESSSLRAEESVCAEEYVSVKQLLCEGDIDRAVQPAATEVFFLVDKSVLVNLS